MPAFSRSDLADLKLFTTIVRRRSFKAAAIELGFSTSALSHAMKKLEARLGVRLLNRTSRTVVPTPVGAVLAAKLEEGFGRIGDALAELEAFRERPVGELRLNVPRDAARLLLAPVLAEFTAAYPEVRLLAVVEDRPVDVVAEGFDAGIRYGDTVPEDMVAAALTRPLRWVVVGAPAYLARRGRPRGPDDLRGHDCIRVLLGDGSPYKWELGDGTAMVEVDVRGRFAVNETASTLAAAIAGVGLAYMLERCAAEAVAAGQLEVVMPEWSSDGPPMCVYSSARARAQPGLRQLVDMIRAREGLPPLP